ncbi:MAG: hypothetical protein ACRDCE_21345 [Cetobacterium sp.]|uniref:hypothetical protein n=1 Tax=Cetobacterium sp. TaxID=2071632 RepID=UPI003EE5E0AE
MIVTEGLLKYLLACDDGVKRFRKTYFKKNPTFFRFLKKAELTLSEIADGYNTDVDRAWLLSKLGSRVHAFPSRDTAKELRKEVYTWLRMNDRISYIPVRDHSCEFPSVMRYLKAGDSIRLFKYLDTKFEEMK